MLFPLSFFFFPAQTSLAFFACCPETLRFALFVNPNSPILKYLDFLLLILEPFLSQIRLWVSHLSLQQQYSPILQKSIYEPLYPMGRTESDADILGTSYPAKWKMEITGADESRLRQAYSILPSIQLRFDTKDIGAVTRVEENKVCVYKGMFRQASGFHSQG